MALGSEAVVIASSAVVVIVATTVLEVTEEVPAGMVALQLMFEVAPMAALFGAMATPLLAPMVTATGLEDVHAHEVVKVACVVASLKVAKALKFSVPPGAMLTAGIGEMAIELRTATTVSVTAGLVMPVALSLAVIMVVPLWTPVAKPAPLIVAFAGVDELQVNDVVRFRFVPSVNMPVAVNGSVSPTFTDEPPVTAIDFNVGVTAGVDVPPPPQPETKTSRVNPQTATALHISDFTPELMAFVLSLQAASKTEILGLGRCCGPP